MALFASTRLTKMSEGFGRKTSSRSPTTSMDGSVAPVYTNRDFTLVSSCDHTQVMVVLTGREKKCKHESTAMIEIFVRLSSFGKRSSDSSKVRAAVATIPDEIAA